MARKLMVVLAAACLWCSVGCHQHGPGETINLREKFAGREPVELFTLTGDGFACSYDNSKPSEDSPVIQESPVSEDTVQLAVEAHVLTVPNDYLEGQNWRKQAGHQIISLEEGRKRLEGMGAVLESFIIHAPRVVIYSGRSTRLTVATQMLFIVDYAREKGGHCVLPAEPIPGLVETGWALSIRVSKQGSQYHVDELDVRGADLMSLRDCQASVPTRDGKATVFWDEPYILAASLDWPEESLAVRDDEMVMVPMSQKLVHTPGSDIRTIAIDGQVRESYGVVGSTNEVPSTHTFNSTCGTHINSRNGPCMASQSWLMLRVTEIKPS